MPGCKTPCRPTFVIGHWATRTLQGRFPTNGRDARRRWAVGNLALLVHLLGTLRCHAEEVGDVGHPKHFMKNACSSFRDSCDLSVPIQVRRTPPSASIPSLIETRPPGQPLLASRSEATTFLDRAISSVDDDILWFVAQLRYRECASHSVFLATFDLEVLAVDPNDPPSLHPTDTDLSRLSLVSYERPSHDRVIGT